MWFDSHCHLQLCENDAPGGAQGLLERARLAGVLELLVVGIDVATSERATELASESGVYASAGVHPNSSGDWSDAARERIDTLLEEDWVVAVGETGLDFYRERATPERQREAFAAHIELAKRHDKALVIHTRDSLDETLDMVSAEGVPERMIFHCWSGDKSQMKIAVELGAHVSFAGNVSFSGAEDLREVARYVPDDRLLVETDSPFLTPVPRRGEPNEPRHVAFVGLALAQTRGVSVHLLAEQTAHNARRVFGLTT